MSPERITPKLKRERKMEFLKKLIRNEEGQGLVEYAMILGIVAIGVAISLNLLGGEIESIFANISSALQNLPWDQ